MKNLKIVFMLFSLLFLTLEAFSQVKKFKCDVSAYADEHTNDQRWNDLIDNACKEINKGKYDEGYILLLDAMTYDSLHSDNGVIHEYFGVQLRKLKNYIDNSKSESNSDGNPLPSNSNTGTEVASPAQNETLNTSETENKKVESTDAPKPVVPESPPPDPVLVPVIENLEPEKSIDNSVKTFSELELTEFHDKGFAKLNLLESYLQDISSKSTPADLAEKDIENAIHLFDNEDRTVQVSSVKTPVKNTYRIRKYLEKLQILNYDNINIEWAEFEYTSDFRKGYDGNYHGYITFKQRFTASKDYIPVYEDITTKKIEVIIKPYEKGIEGEKYDVFLGDMSVIQTDKK